jgi:hypothetical protein
MILFSILYGIAAVYIFRRFTDKPSIRRTVNRILAHVMELGLFLDSPSLILRAQRDLLKENLLLLRLTILPAAILALLFAILYQPLNATYGRAPLPVGEPAVVTIPIEDKIPQLDPPAGIALETPAVRVLHDHEISWRVRPLRPTSTNLKFRIDNRIATSIKIPYPERAWLLEFALISSLSAAIFGLSWNRDRQGADRRS